jgi:myo-inositol-1(or 4)-monophosphatase
MTDSGRLSTEDVQFVVALVRKVGAELLRWRPNREGAIDLDISQKMDGSLVSAADHAAQELFFSEISARFPEEPVLSEEGVLNDDGKSERSWILDPLDGTREFLSGTPDFAVQLACCWRGNVIGGWIYFPAIDCLIESNTGLAAYCNGRSLSVRDRRNLEPARVLVRGVSCRDTRAQHPIIDTQVALRRFLVGELDVVIIRLGRLGVWDVAGWSIIVEAAGGLVCNGKGVRPEFGARLPAEDFVIFALPSLKEEAVSIASTLTEDPCSEKRG